MTSNQGDFTSHNTYLRDITCENCHLELNVRGSDEEASNCQKKLQGSTFKGANLHTDVLKEKNAASRLNKRNPVS